MKLPSAVKQPSAVKLLRNGAGQREALWRGSSFGSEVASQRTVRGRHFGGEVPSEVKLLRSEVAFGSEAAYGCEVASQRDGSEGGSVKATPHHSGLSAEPLMCANTIGDLAELLLGSL